MKKSDWAIREERERMMGAVVGIQRKYKRLDDFNWNKDQDIRAIEAAISKYGDELRKPLLRFFTGDVLELVTTEAHDQFLKSIVSYVKEGKLGKPNLTTDQIIESLRTQLVQNIDSLISGADLSMKQRAIKLQELAAKSVNNAATAQITGTQLKIESITRRTLAYAQDMDLLSGDFVGEIDLQKGWELLKSKYGTRETVRYRNGANYPLNTYLEGRANTTSADIHRVTTQLDATASGVHTGMVSRHGATDSCRPWEGKILFFTPAGRDIMSKKFPAMAQWSTVDEVKADEDTHMWKFNCRHIITPYPIQFFDDAENHKLIKEQAA
jgi:hypothetical protein